MKRLRSAYLGAVMICALCLGGIVGGALAEDRPTVLVVMSYEADYPWCVDTLEGIKAVLADACRIETVYLNTKTDPDGGPARAEAAWKRYRAISPAGVIAADDNAQSMFVVPYLRGKVETPVMFCGVNGDPEDYGYPSDNVSGILERFHIAETIAFSQQLYPAIESMGFIIKAGPTAELVRRQVERERHTYPARVRPDDFITPRTLDGAIRAAADLGKRCDLLFTSALHGITDRDGRHLSEAEAIPLVAGAFPGPVTGNAVSVRHGLLCSVAHTGHEQGETAAIMLKKAMSGTPVADLPITRNWQGMRVINVTVMREMGLKPSPSVLLGTEIIRTEP